MATTSTPLHKVKEEAKEYFGYQQSSEASSATTTATTTMTTPTTTTTATTKTTTTTTTTTTSMATTTTTTTTTATTSTSLATVASIVTAPNSSTIVNGTGGVVPSVATSPPITVPNVSSPATTSALHQSTGVVCHLSVPASSVLVNADPFPVDLDLKTKIKGACFLFSSFDRSNLWRWSASKNHLTTRPPRTPDGRPRWMSERKKKRKRKEGGEGEIHPRVFGALARENVRSG